MVAMCVKSEIAMLLQLYDIFKLTVHRSSSIVHRLLSHIDMYNIQRFHSNNNLIRTLIFLKCIQYLVSINFCMFVVCPCIFHFASCFFFLLLRYCRSITHIIRLVNSIQFDLCLHPCLIPFVLTTRQTTMENLLARNYNDRNY